jgi:CheY-like chemotaxis protein
MAVKVLVVEDEVLLRKDIVDALEQRGFVVVEAENATRAVEVLIQHPNVQVMFTDIDMPGGVDGVKLAAMVRDRWPPIKIVYTSGHRKPADLDLPLESQFFAKPYNPDRVAATLLALAAH